MWKLMKFLLWIACAMSFGVLLSTVKVAGQTPVQRAQRMWVKYGVDGKVEEHVSDLKDSVQGAFDSVKDRITGDAKRKPSEHHSAHDRESVNKLIAKHNNRNE